MWLLTPCGIRHQGIRVLKTEDIAERLRGGLVKDFEVEESLIEADANLVGDIGLDSLDLVDVVVMVDNLFGVKLTRDELMAAKTFGKLTDLVASKLQ